MRFKRTGFIKGVNNLLYYWFPVLPFLSYWVVAYFAFNFGPFVTPELDVYTHIYIVLYMATFAIAYRLGLRMTSHSVRPCFGIDDAIAIKLLKRTSWLTFIGTLIFIYDRLTSGAGSFSVVQNELSSVRDDYAGRVTFLTTLAVIPQSFRLVTFATYFYANWRKLQIPKIVHFLVFLTIFLELINMVLSANRGSLFWILSYAIFYFIFCVKINIFSIFFSLRNIGIKVLFSACFLIAYSYFAWVAENRVVSSTAEYLGVEAFSLLKEPGDYSFKSYSALGAEYHLFYYLTHGFQYVDAILKHAAVINFDLISPLGIRLEAQLSRFIAGYVHPAKADILMWIYSEGLSQSGWPTIFGASLAYFGIIGSLCFSALIGYFSGYSVRRWVNSFRLGWLILVFLIFSSLNVSFDWIVRDFDQYVAFVVGVYLIKTAQVRRLRAII